MIIVLLFHIVLLRPLYLNTTDCLTTNILFSVQKTGKSKINVVADSMSGEGSLPSLYMAAFLLYLHKTERDLVPPYEDTSLIMGHHPHNLLI